MAIKLVHGSTGLGFWGRGHLSPHGIVSITMLTPLYVAIIVLSALKS
ncbi:hypothetical protein [Undibacterium rugosum]|uniref:Uncharacterized protein n=1 Tax=Undibacterium rugosum TaxID=2762291 RepID=A0A923KUX0_9BURK|nr:hypothetical protein [Undibacterium rugosum]MBC3934702.1 hypothetical protein [Undibacterium rugosum]MBR7779748.1 hypothetical protein [Undibacterium rugosum]